jgi:hypothetical protein
MKTPVQPPNFQTLLYRANDAGRMAGLLEAPAADDDYLRWDELRRRKPPPGLALEEWWLALKLGRRMQYRPLPCTDAGGAPFRCALADAVLAGLHAVDKGGGTAVGALTGFTVAGADKKFVPAQARMEGGAVIVSSPDVPAPAAVRCAWENDPVCNLFNGAGLPASPFRTDAW